MSEEKLPYIGKIIAITHNLLQSVSISKLIAKEEQKKNEGEKKNDEL